MTVRLLLSWSLLPTLALAACRTETISKPVGAPRPPRFEQRREHDPDTGRLVHEWTVLRSPGQGAIKDGVERIWYPDGTKHWEREFRRGKPAGAWRSWHPGGIPRSECFYRGPDVDAQMSFWHANGKLSAQGPARDGARRGTWRFWFENGQLAEEGEYVSGMRAGTWTAWSEDGLQRFERVYKRNVRVSQRPIPDAAD